MNHRRHQPTRHQFRRFLSQRSMMIITIASLAGLMILVLIGTLLQVNLSINEIEKEVISSFFVYYQGIPVFPGGATFATILLLTLTFTFLKNKYWKKPSLLLIHAGFTLLIAGEILRLLSSEESFIMLSKDHKRNFSESSTDFELALIDRSHSGYDQVTAIPLRGNSFEGTVPNTPLKIKVTDQIYELEGLGKWPIEIGTRHADNYDIAIRRKRSYHPFYLELEAFDQEYHPGTSIPKSFSSKISLYNALGQYDRTVTISMNSPLHYQGKTFYQSSFDDTGTASILHVVENRWKALPYLSLGLIALGLVLHSINVFRRRQ